uniref:Uncharacterized protein n=1 Tax=Anguilla anguilla TaxID=7936 RepID=A0A0E9S0B1_ANGAN
MSPTPLDFALLYFHWSRDLTLAINSSEGVKV